MGASTTPEGRGQRPGPRRRGCNGARRGLRSAAPARRSTAAAGVDAISSTSSTSATRSALCSVCMLILVSSSLSASCSIGAPAHGSKHAWCTVCGPIDGRGATPRRPRARARSAGRGRARQSPCCTEAYGSSTVGRLSPISPGAPPREVVFPYPSAPLLFWPQHFSVRLSRTAQKK